MENAHAFQDSDYEKWNQDLIFQICSRSDENALFETIKGICQWFDKRDTNFKDGQFPQHMMKGLLEITSQTIHEINNLKIQFTRLMRKFYCFKDKQFCLTFSCYDEFIENQSELDKINCSITTLKIEFKMIWNYLQSHKDYWLLISNNPDINGLFSSYLNLCKNLDKFEALSKRLFEKKKNFDIYKNKHIYLFPKDVCDEGNFIMYDTETKTQKFRSINFPKQLSIGTCITQLPNGQLFCFGNEYPARGTTCIIDSQLNAKRLKSGKPWYMCGSIYFEDNVYIFGGFGTQDLNCVEKFDLKRGKWSKICRMPKSSPFCSCLAFKESILVSGSNHDILYKYDLGLNSYSKILTFNLSYNKVLASAKGRVYIFNSCEKTYESGILDEYKWNEISILNPIIGLMCSRTYNNNSIVFGAASYDKTVFYRFDLETKQLTLDSKIII